MTTVVSTAQSGWRRVANATIHRSVLLAFPWASSIVNMYYSKAMEKWHSQHRPNPSPSLPILPDRPNHASPGLPARLPKLPPRPIGDPNTQALRPHPGPQKPRPLDRAWSQIAAIDRPNCSFTVIPTVLPRVHPQVCPKIRPCPSLRLPDLTQIHPIRTRITQRFPIPR